MIRPCLATALATLVGAAAPGQLPPGHALVVEGPLPATVSAFEPLQGTSAPLQLPSLPPVQSAALSLDHTALWLGTRASGLPAALYRLPLAGTVGGTPRLVASGLGGDVLTVVPLDPGTVAVLTTTGVQRVDTNTGTATVLLPSSSTGTVVALAARSSGGSRQLAALTDLNGAAHCVPLGPWGPAVSPIPLPGVTNALSLHHLPGKRSWVVGTAAGDLFLVDDAYYRPVRWTSVAPHAARSLTRTEADGLLVGSAATVHGITANGTRTFPAPAGGTVRALDYAPYTSTFAVRGAGCPGGSGLVPRIDAAGRPHPGNPSFAVTVDGTVSSAPALLAMGSSRRRADLTPLGLPGCWLLVDPASTFITRTAPLGGVSAVALPVPPDPGLAGSTFHFQWAVLDPGANALDIALSARGTATL